MIWWRLRREYAQNAPSLRTPAPRFPTSGRASPSHSKARPSPAGNNGESYLSTQCRKPTRRLQRCNRPARNARTLNDVMNGYAPFFQFTTGIRENAGSRKMQPWASTGCLRRAPNSCASRSISPPSGPRLPTTSNPAKGRHEHHSNVSLPSSKPPPPSVPASAIGVLLTTMLSAFLLRLPPPQPGLLPLSLFVKVKPTSAPARLQRVGATPLTN